MIFVHICFNSIQPNPILIDSARHHNVGNVLSALNFFKELKQIAYKSLITVSLYFYSHFFLVSFQVKHNIWLRNIRPQQSIEQVCKFYRP